MPIVKYRTRIGTYLNLTKEDYLLAPIHFQVTPSNAKLGEGLYRKKAKIAKNMEYSTTLGTSRFKLNVKIDADQTSDPEIDLENYWYLQDISIWASDLEVPYKHWCNAHITMWPIKTIGRRVSNAPRLYGEVCVNIVDIFNSTKYFNEIFSYQPYDNRIRIG